jgi:hypothetical protein
MRPGYSLKIVGYLVLVELIGATAPGFAQTTRSAEVQVAALALPAARLRTGSSGIRF